jgi:hypothetical protein
MRLYGQQARGILCFQLLRASRSIPVTMSVALPEAGEHRGTRRRGRISVSGGLLACRSPARGAAAGAILAGGSTHTGRAPSP